MEYGATEWPTCTDDCVDTGVGGLGYVETARAWDSRCQGNFGLEYHAIFGEYEYHSSSKDQGARVPKDSNAFNLNASSTSAPRIYACGVQIRRLSAARRAARALAVRSAAERFIGGGRQGL